MKATIVLTQEQIESALRARYNKMQAAQWRGTPNPPIVPPVKVRLCAITQQPDRPWGGGGTAITAEVEMEVPTDED